MDLKKHIRTVPNFPQKGVMFRDVTTLFQNADVFHYIIEQFKNIWSKSDIDAIAGIDARGFIIGAALAHHMHLPFIPLRKKGKLPFDTITRDYNLEYGTATLEVHVDAINPGDRVLIVDDLIATGGTASASIDLIRDLRGVVVGCGFIVDLPELGGSGKINGMNVESKSLIQFAGH